MRVPYGLDKEPFRFSLFLVFCNRIITSAVSAGFLLVSSYYHISIFCLVGLDEVQVLERSILLSIKL